MKETFGTIYSSVPDIRYSFADCTWSSRDCDAWIDGSKSMPWCMRTPQLLSVQKQTGPPYQKWPQKIGILKHKYPSPLALHTNVPMIWWKAQEHKNFSAVPTPRGRGGRTGPPSPNHLKQKYNTKVHVVMCTHPLILNILGHKYLFIPITTENPANCWFDSTLKNPRLSP